MTHAVKARAARVVILSELLQVFARKGKRGDHDVAHLRGQDVRFSLGYLSCLVGYQHLGYRVPALRVGALVAQAA